MTNSITTLTCPSCGGKLQIAKSISRFACGYCGNEHVVHRESGIVYLEPIAEDIHHIRASVEGVRGGVDKTAAELAIARLGKELSELETELSVMAKKKTDDLLPRSNLEFILAIAALVLFVLLAFTNGNPVAGNLWLISLIVLLFLWLRRRGAANKLKKEAIQDIQSEMEETKDLITKNRKLIQ